MIKMSDREFNEYDAAWDEARECFFMIKRKKARIVTVRKKDGRTIRYTVPKDSAND